MLDPINKARELEANVQKRKAEIRAYNSNVMPCAKDFNAQIVAAARRPFDVMPDGIDGKPERLLVTEIACNGYIWQRGQHNDKAQPINHTHAHIKITD